MWVNARGVPVQGVGRHHRARSFAGHGRGSHTNRPGCRGGGQQPRNQREKRGAIVGLDDIVGHARCEGIMDVLLGRQTDTAEGLLCDHPR